MTEKKKSKKPWCRLEGTTLYVTETDPDTEYACAAAIPIGRLSHVMVFGQDVRVYLRGAPGAQAESVSLTLPLQAAQEAPRVLMQKAKQARNNEGPLVPKINVTVSESGVVRFCGLIDSCHALLGNLHDWTVRKISRTHVLVELRFHGITYSARTEGDREEIAEELGKILAPRRRTQLLRDLANEAGI